MSAAAPDPRLYGLLGLETGAHPDEIRRAYRKLARQVHPDVAGAGDEAAASTFRALTAAHDHLLAFLREHPEAITREAPERGAVSSEAPAGPGPAPVAPELPLFGVQISFAEAFTGGRVQRDGVMDGRTEMRTVEAIIPAGAFTGVIVEGRCLGQPAHVRLTVEDSPLFRRLSNQADLEVILPLTIGEATLGAASVPIAAPDGIVHIPVPELVGVGKRLRVAGRGMPRVDGSGRGDLIVITTVRVPEQLSSAQRNLLGQLGRTEPKPAGRL